jgi:hypothetical protein
MKNMALIILTILFLVVLAPAGSVSTAQAASTTSVLGGGVAINEILVNPGGSSAEFDLLKIAMSFSSCTTLDQPR